MVGSKHQTETATIAHRRFSDDQRQGNEPILLLQKPLISSQLSSDEKNFDGALVAAELLTLVCALAWGAQRRDCCDAGNPITKQTEACFIPDTGQTLGLRPRPVNVQKWSATGPRS